MTPMRVHGFRRFISLTVSFLISLSVAVLSPAQGHTASRLLDAPPPSCVGQTDIGVFGPLGSRDFWVDGGPVALQGVHAFERLCIEDGGTLIARGDLTLHVGLLYIAAGSALVADGLHGFTWDTHDCTPSGEELDDGEPGHSLTIFAQRAIIDGRVSANGGHGISYSLRCTGRTGVGSGGHGGTISIVANDLTLSGKVSADGGDGGSSMRSDPSLPYWSGPSGNGGNGGRIILRLAHPTQVRRQSMDVQAGRAGSHDRGPAGRAGVAGSVQIAVLSAADRTELPLGPAPFLVYAPTAAHIQPLETQAAQYPSLQCGPHDLIVGAKQTLTLTGIHQYTHVCIANGGAIQGLGTLTIMAQTISIALGAMISLVGGSNSALHTGRYDSMWLCTSDHFPSHVGVGGPDGMSWQSLTNPSTPSIQFKAHGGAGGGALTLIAQSVVLQGIVTADGARGEGIPSDQNEVQVLEQGTLSGGGGGSGGSITVIAHQVDLGGQVSAAGGDGGNGQLGAPNPDANSVEDVPDPNGSHGSAGCIKVLADQVSAASPALPTYGSTFVDRRLPSDPVAPVPTSPHLIYIASAHHTLADPFLTFWKANGGLSIFGYPQTEAFREGGHEVQYTDRALFEVIHGQVEVAPLGRVLTAGRHFTRVAPVPSTPERLYFAATGHTLSGQFLAFWRTHRGSVLLGAPISEVLVDTNGDGSGRKYPLQWFERGRLEYHAELAKTPYKIELGLLGVEALQVRGWRP